MPFFNGGHVWLMFIVLAILALAVFGLLIGIRWAVRAGQPPSARYGAPPPPAVSPPLSPPPPPG
jgi:hypothetical protein